MKDNKSASSKKVFRLRRALVLSTIMPVLVVGLLFGIASYFNSRKDTKTQAAQIVGNPPYDPLVLFNQPIPDNYPSDPNSSAIINRIKNDWARYNWSYSGEVPTVYEASNSSTTKYSSTISGVTYQIPTPGNIVAGGGSDRPLILLNSSTLQEFRFWKANINSTSKTITYSGAGVFYYNNDGTLHNGKRSLSVPFAGAGTGSGLSYFAGLVTNEDYNSGVIKHAIRFANSCSNSTATYRPPAVKTDQPHSSCTSSNPSSSSSIEMGSILQLDKSIDCNSRTVPTKTTGSKETKVLRMVCKAMQDYGAIMLDGTSAGGGANFYMEDSQTAFWGLDDKGKGNYGWIFRPPYYSSDGVSRNGTTDGIPLDKMRVLQRPASAISWGAGDPVGSNNGSTSNNTSSSSSTNASSSSNSSSGSSTSTTTNSDSSNSTNSGGAGNNDTSVDNSLGNNPLAINDSQGNNASSESNDGFMGFLIQNDTVQEPVEQTKEAIKTSPTATRLLAFYFGVQVIFVIIKYIFY